MRTHRIRFNHEVVEKYTKYNNSLTQKLINNILCIHAYEMCASFSLNYSSMYELIDSTS